MSDTLRKDGVYGLRGWSLPDMGRDVVFRLNKARSNLFRKIWTYDSSGGFLHVSRAGDVSPTASSGEKDPMFEKVIVVGESGWETMLKEADTDRGLPPRLWYSTDAAQIFVVWGFSSFHLNKMPLTEYGAEDVESLVAGWRDRRR